MYTLCTCIHELTDIRHRSIRSDLESYTVSLVLRKFNVSVTECICTLCLCCCMYSVRVALSVFFRVCASFDLLRMCYVLWFRRHYKSEREKARGKNNDLSYVRSKRKEEIKSGTSGCGSFVKLFLTSNLQLPPTVYTYLWHKVTCYVY